MNFPTIIDAMIDNVLIRPQKKAFIFLRDGESNKQELTFEDFYLKVAVFSGFLRENYRKHDRVMLCYPPGLEYITAFFACLTNGLIAVPIYPPDTRNNERIKCIIKDCDAKLALTTDEIFEKTKEPGFSLNYKGLSWVSTNFVNAEIRGNHNLINNSLPEDIAFLQYTSGSTSNPKGVMVTHENLMANSQLIKKQYQHTDNSVLVSWLPPYHDMGLVGSIVQPMFMGMTGIHMSPSSFLKRPVRWLRAISEYSKLGPVTSGGPNFSFEICCNYIGNERMHGVDLSNWRIAYNGAEPIRAETLNKFVNKFEPFGFSCKSFYPVYGLAEATLMASAGNIMSEPIIKAFKTESLKVGIAEEEKDSNFKTCIELTGCGQNLEGQKIIIVNPETLYSCKDREIGEIWIKGPGIALGYWQNEDATRISFNAYTNDTSEGPFLRTGDLGFFLDGELFVTGRLKELIIIRGQNFYPQDIEQAVEKSCECIRSGCGTSFSVDIDNDEKLVVVCELNRKHLRGLDHESIKSAIRKAVSENFELNVYDIVFIETSSFPKTSSGKLQRLLVKQMYLANELKLSEHNPDEYVEK